MPPTLIPCKAIRYPPGDTIGRPCLRYAMPSGFCYNHDPKSIQACEDRARQTKAEREAQRDQHARKLLLIPILDLATRRRGKMRNETARLGATAIINILECAIRGE